MELPSKFTQAQVEGVPTYEFAEESKHDLKVMMACAEAELKNFYTNSGQIAPAPFFCERATVLLSKMKRWTETIKVAEAYLCALDEYKKNATKHHAKVWLSPKVSKIKQRLAKAKIKTNTSL